MAKTATKKVKLTAKAEDSVKKGAAKKAAEKTVETKKITAAKEPEKITAAKEPEKITAAKEPEKIAAKPEPAKLEEKKVEKLEVKEEKAVKKPAAKKTAAKKETTKKEPAKKTTAKKTVAAETKAEPVAVKEEKKPVEKKTAAKKTTAKKAVEKKEPAKKAAAKKAVPAYVKEYEAMNLDECIAKMQAMGVLYGYDDYTRILLNEADDSVLIKNIVEGNHIDEKGFTFEKDGFDAELIPVTLKKVKDTMDIKAADFKDIKKDMEASLKTTLGEDAEANAAEYLKEFKTCEKMLMIGQRKNIVSGEELGKLLNVDVDAFLAHFLELAYGILPTWQYDDVKFYEDFIYAVLSQFADLYEKYQLRTLIDVADLYIKHGDFQHGDVCYGYILRDNQIKDYIYYRFAHVYEDIDFNKAKALAYESLQFVDGRYTYYQNIMDIINK